MSTLTMPLADAILASKALLNHVSTDDITPVITHAAVVEHEDQKYLVATDRYSFGRFRLGAADQFDGESGMMIPRDALLWVSKIVPKSLRRGGFIMDVPVGEGGYGIRFTWTRDESRPRGYELEVAIIFDSKPERTQTFDVYSGNFPPVVRLWLDDTVESSPVATVALSHLSLSKVIADVALFEGKGGSVPFRFRSDPESKKPMPVQYTLGARWEAVIQPTTLLR